MERGRRAATGESSTLLPGRKISSAATMGESLGAATGEEEIERYDYGGSRIITIKNKIGLKPPHQKLPPAKAPQNKMTKNQQLLRWGLKRREIKERANHDANH
uniref:Uncharacterized protein n=1 Tax=Arundo donax TaxID=35708 RepID=A0A0A8ZD62_ARUDO